MRNWMVWLGPQTSLLVRALGSKGGLHSDLIREGVHRPFLPLPTEQYLGGLLHGDKVGATGLPRIEPIKDVPCCPAGEDRCRSFGRNQAEKLVFLEECTADAQSAELA